MVPTCSPDEKAAALSQKAEQRVRTANAHLLKARVGSWTSATLALSESMMYKTNPQTRAPCLHRRPSEGSHRLLL